MITKPSVLLLGAGASADCLFPVGRDFRNRICKLPTSDPNFMAQMQGLGLQDQATDFFDRFRHSEMSSPDRFLEQYSEYLDVGKFAIAYVLGQAETDINVFQTRTRRPSWYKTLTDSLEFESREYKENALSILTFNYDRSLEYFIWKTIEAYYRPDTIKMNRLWNEKPRIVHLHGILGAFDPIGNVGRPYAPPTIQKGISEELRLAADGIKIIHEVEADTPEFDEAEAMLCDAEKVVFLGFGFDKRNVQRLRVFEKPLGDKIVLGTGQGLTTEDHARIQAGVFNGHTNVDAFQATDIQALLHNFPLN